MRTLLIEDEVHTRRYLRELLAEEEDVLIIGEAASGSEAVKHIRALSPDLVFLDIQIPELDAFEVISKIGSENMPAFIFVTAYSEYALRAFEAGAVDYLCKPFDRERLSASVQRATKLLRTRRDSQRGMAAPEPLSRIAVHEDNGIVFVPVEKILWIEAANKYVVIHTVDGTHTARHTMQTMEERLDPKHFARIHRSIFVRKAAVRGLYPLFHGDYLVKLNNGSELRLSRNFRESFFELMGR